jgi:hypothetical protein
MAERPLCFVLMPFGRKRDFASGRELDFDDVYERAIRPAIEGAGMEPIRADEERTGGIIHRAMFERLLLCDYAVADLTTANANVFYELGVRHATRPATTLPIFASHQMPPFDVGYLRALPYEIADGPGLSDAEAERLRSALRGRLEQLRDLAHEDAAVDSPIFQLLEDYSPPDIARLGTDLFRERARYSAEVKRGLRSAREDEDPEALGRVEAGMGSLDGAEAGVLIDLFLSWRAIEAWDRMISLYERLPAALRRTTMVRQQYALALNRDGDRSRAAEVLEDLIDERGASSESYGILGRVYKDLWRDARAAGQDARAEGCLTRAIDAYVRGFEADWRDAYPGINALTLLEVRGDEAALARKAELQPVVRYAVRRRIASARPDYWDRATLLELAVLEADEPESRARLSDALAAVRERWEPATTAGNLTLIRDARRARGHDVAWLDAVIDALGSAQVGTGSGTSSARV